MTTKHRHGKLTCLLVFVLLVCLLSACRLEMGNDPQAWIDVPWDGKRLEVGQAVEIKAHVYSRQGVKEVLLAVDGVPLSLQPPLNPGANFSAVDMQWHAEEPGEHVIQVIAYNAQGEPSNPASVLVNVLPGEAVVATRTPISTISPTNTMTPTIRPAVKARVWADEVSLVRGECTMLHWEVEHAVKVLLEGQEVEEVGSREVCPDVTVEYSLQASTEGEEVTETVQVVVTEPPDTTPPNIANVTASETQIYEPFCEPNEVTIRTDVTDNVGVSHVELIYRVVDSSRQGQWRAITMSATGGNNFQAVLGWMDLESSLDPPVISTATIEYYIEARDGNGNEVQSGHQSVSLKDCLL